MEFTQAAARLIAMFYNAIADPMRDALRLFVAIRPPADIRTALLDTMGGIPGARWQDDDQLHLTLAFLGDVTSRAADDLVESLETIEAAPFELSLSGVGHFEHRGVPSAVWAGVSPSPELAALRKRVTGTCRRAGVPPDPAGFRPHITLARLSRTAGPIGGWLAANGLLASDPWTVRGFTLFASHLGPGGATYEAVANFSLAR